MDFFLEKNKRVCPFIREVRVRIFLKKQCWPYMVFIQNIIQKRLQVRTILFTHRECVNEKEILSKHIENPSNLTVFLTISLNKLPYYEYT